MITSRPLLTIAIPTFNRLDCLRLLLGSLISQATISNVLGTQLTILICNNASTDGTNEYLNEIRKIEGIEVIHHPVNCGGDPNILYCCQAARSKYVWVVGDDDVPLCGAINAVLTCLERDEPDLLYLPSRWIAGSLVKYSNEMINSLHVISHSALDFAIKASVYVTFISAWVINLETYAKKVPNPRLDRYSGTSFAQLEWNLSLINDGNKLMSAKDTWLIARGGNTGGYSLFDAFSRQYNNIIDEKFTANSQLYRFFRNNMLWSFIPSLVWGMRKRNMGNFGEFDKEKTLNILKSAYGNNIFFMVVVVPMIKFSKPLAWCFRVGALIFRKLWLLWWKKSAR